MNILILKKITMHHDVAIIIPARLGSQRLLQKPLAKIGNQTMIEHVLKNVQKTKLDNIYVATDSDLIAEHIDEVGGKYILTNSECTSGTDRVYNALQSLKHLDIQYVINVQGDMPFIEPEIINSVIEYLKNSSYEIVTPVAKVEKDVADSSSNVKVVMGQNNKALYFSRSLIPHGAQEFWYHIGVYGFTCDALAKFITLPQSSLGILENLEQLRAIENNMDIGLNIVNTIPISVDTPEDLANAIRFYDNITQTS